MLGGGGAFGRTVCMAPNRINSVLFMIYGSLMMTEFFLCRFEYLYVRWL